MERVETTADGKKPTTESSGGSRAGVETAVEETAAGVETAAESYAESSAASASSIPTPACHDRHSRA